MVHTINIIEIILYICIATHVNNNWIWIRVIWKTATNISENFFGKKASSVVTTIYNVEISHLLVEWQTRCSPHTWVALLENPIFRLWLLTKTIFSRFLARTTSFVTKIQSVILLFGIVKMTFSSESWITDI